MNPTWKEHHIWLGVAAAILVTRLPFLGAGYGIDPDAWRVIYSARVFDLTGIYSTSRLPGYPLVEIGCSYLWELGPWAVNGVTALLSAVGLGCFALSMRRVGLRDWWLAALALAMLPVVYINSTMLMDYVWALSFILIAHYLVQLGRPFFAGAFLGLAIGCRITSGAMLLPLALLLFDASDKVGSLRAIVKLALATLVVGAIAFSPVITWYGYDFFTFLEVWPPLLQLLKVTVHDTLGVVGAGCLAVVMALWAFSPGLRNSTPSVFRRATPMQLVAWGSAVGLYLIAFVRLPIEAGYLIPLFPFLVLLLAQFLPRRLFAALCVGLIISPFLITIDRDGRFGEPTASRWAITFQLMGQSIIVEPFRGPIIYDSVHRLSRLQAARTVIEASEGLPDNSVVVCGYWRQQIRALLPRDYPGRVEFVAGADGAEVEKYKQSGRNLYYLPGQRHRLVVGGQKDIEAYGATELSLSTVSRGLGNPYKVAD